jgi:hypothetical protein
VNAFRLLPTAAAGGSQGDIYAIAATVAELNAIYQVRYIGWSAALVINAVMQQLVVRPVNEIVQGTCRNTFHRCILNLLLLLLLLLLPQLFAKYYRKLTDMTVDKIRGQAADLPQHSPLLYPEPFAAAATHCSCLPSTT